MGDSIKVGIAFDFLKIVFLKILMIENSENFKLSVSCVLFKKVKIIVLSILNVHEISNDEFEL